MCWKWLEIDEHPDQLVVVVFKFIVSSENCVGRMTSALYNLFTSNKRLRPVSLNHFRVISF